MQNTIQTRQQEEEFALILSKFAHEIRNPVALISSNLQIIAASHPEAASFEGWDDIMENLEYIKELLNDVTRYSSAARIIKKPEDPAALLRSAADSVRPSLEYLGISLQTEIPDTLPVLPLDRVRIRQALLNLLRNAREAIQHSHGLIRLQAVSLPEGVKITVSDNGCGMTPFQLENIFRPFVSYKPEGTGLGLAVTRQIIEAHGGELTAASVPGEGTVFQILLRG